MKPQPSNLMTSFSSHKSILPNVVLAGVRKCGTTSVYKWLSDHPDVCHSSEKGTEFLMDRDSLYVNQRANYHEHGLDRYSDCFPNYRGERFVLDATTRYFDQNTARNVLASLNDPPHVVFFLREPADRLLSSYQYNKNNRRIVDPRTTFADYVQGIMQNRVESLLSSDVSDDTGSRRSKCVGDLQHAIRWGQYAEFLTLWRESLGPHRMHVYLYEHMKEEPRSMMCKLAADVGIEPSFYRHYKFTARNRTMHVRSHLLHAMIDNLKWAIPKTTFTRKLRNMYFMLQSSSGDRRLDRKDQQALQQLRSYYRPFNERLASEFELDLSAWTELGEGHR